VAWWGATGFLRPHQRLVERALALAEDTGHDGPDLAVAAAWAGILGLEHHLAEDVDGVIERLQRAECSARRSGDHHALREVLACWMLMIPFTGDLDRAVSAGAEGLALSVADGLEGWIGGFEVWSGMIAHQIGDDTRAVELGLRALGRARRGGDQHTLVLAAMLLGPLRGKFPEVDAQLPPVEDTIETAMAIGETLLAGVLLPVAIAQAAAGGDLDQAARRAVQACSFGRTAPRAAIGYVLLSGVHLLMAMDRMDDAAVVDAVVEPHLPLLEPTMPSESVDAMRWVRGRLHHVLGKEGVARARRRSLALDWDDALVLLEQAAEEHLRSRSAAAEPAGVGAVVHTTPKAADSANPLTPRQIEVLRRLAAGGTNREIGAHLGMAPKTVAHHLEAIYLALGVRGRGEAIAWAIRSGAA
jgi:DNA-binding CsgD family transcriptional regulator